MIHRLSILLLCFASAHAATVFVAPTGSDANPGTLAQPWATMNFAITNVLSGDTVLVQPGIYDELITFSTPGVTLKANAALAVTNKGAFHFKAGSAGTVIDGFNLTMQSIALTTNFDYYFGTYPIAFSFENSSTISNVWLVNNFIHDNRTSFYPTRYSCCFSMQSTSGTPWPPNAPVNCVISNNVCSNIFGWISVLAGTGHKFVNNTITRTHSHDFMWPFGADHLIQGNNVTHCEQEDGNDADHPDLFQVVGLGGTSMSSNIMVSANYLADGWNCSVLGFSQEGGDGIRNWTFQNNIWSRIGLGGGMNVPFVRFFNNLFWVCNYNGASHPLVIGSYPPGPNPGFSRGISTNCEIRNNAFVMCASLTSTNLGWYSASAEASTYATFAPTNSGSGGGSWTSIFSTSGCPTEDCMQISLLFTNMSGTLTSCIISGPNGDMYNVASYIIPANFHNTPGFGTYYSFTQPLTNGVQGLSIVEQRQQANSNLWWITVHTTTKPAGELIAPLLFWVGPTDLYTNSDYNFVCSTNWWPKRQVVGHPDPFNWWEDHGINGGDPGFTNTAANDFHLLASSLLKGKGTPIAGVTTDFDGKLRANPPSIGPFEAPNQGIYYIDWDTGNDANSGTDKLNPWKRCPGMNGFSGSYSHLPGDQFIFKGGVTWPNSAFQLKITAGGTDNTVQDIYGTDFTWFIGPFWTQPIWDFQDIALGTGFNSGAGVLLDASGGMFGYVSFQFLEIKRHRGYLAPNDFGACTFTLASAPHHITWANCYIHDWSIPLPAPGQDGTGGGGICMVAGGGTGCRVSGCVLTQAGALNGCRSGRALSMFGIIEYTTIYDTPNAFLGSGTIHDCDIHDIVGASDTLAHENGIFCFAPSNVFNNRVYNIVSSGSAIYLDPSFSGGTGNDRCYNNLVYNTGAQAPIQIDTDGATPNLTGSHIWNNTLVANNGYCIRVVYRAGQPSFGLLDMVNNHLITSGGTAICYNNTGAGCANVLVVTNTANLIQTVTAATAAGYTESNGYQPTLVSSPTVATGNDLSFEFTTSLLGVLRPANFWDKGAYQFSGSPPPPPTPSRVTIRTTALRANMIRTK